MLIGRKGMQTLEANLVVFLCSCCVQLDRQVGSDCKEVCDLLL